MNCNPAAGPGWRACCCCTQLGAARPDRQLAQQLGQRVPDLQRAAAAARAAAE
jgi:hypothetical protein